VHAAPANFAFGGEAFAVVLGDLAGFAEGLGDELGGALRVFVPGGDAGGAVDADDAVGAHAELAEFLGDADGLATWVTQLARAFSSPPAEASNQTGATTEPTTRPLT
jgi:hypothetical protein